MNKKRFEKNKSEIRKKDGGATARKPKKRRRSSAGKIALVLTVLMVALVGVVLSLTVFFETKEIDFDGDSRYSTKEIEKAGEIKLGSNLIRLDSEEIANRIEAKLPYIEKVEIEKKLPSTIIIKVTEARVAGYVETSEGYSIVSTRGKILEKTKDKPEKMAKLLGIEANGVKLAAYVSDENGALSSARAIYENLGIGMSSGVTVMNVEDRINLEFVYRDRITVRLGSETDLEEKIKFVLKILNNPEEIDEDDMGIIYASNAKRISFLRKGSYKEYLMQLEAEKEKLETENQDNNSSGIAIEETPENTQNTNSNTISSDKETSSQN